LKSNSNLNNFATYKGLCESMERYVCGTTQGTPTLTIPEGKTFLLQPLSFQGPCKSTTIQVEVLYF